jgi:elongator complex protein 3
MLPLNKNQIRKPTKTLSGVAPLAVIIKPRPCKHGTCLFCPTLDVPQSYTPKSPAIMRAILLDYNPKKQVEARIAAYKAMNHPTDKIELIVMGGTFLDYPIKYQYSFIKACYDALNNKQSKSLDEAKKINEKAKHRCVALCIETRPDVCGSKEIKRMLEFGCTRVELGVQAIDDKIYKLCKRGHTVKDVVEATARLRENGFKIGYHLMPGIPGSNKEKDLAMFKEIFENENFKPDQLKIYPCQVIKGAQLEKLYHKRKYCPYTEEELKELIIKFLHLTPRYCRIMRIMREIPPDYLTAGTLHIDLRKDIDEALRKNKTALKEIRFREIGLHSRYNQDIDKHLELKTTNYNASGGQEYFLEIVNKDDILFALLRLYIKKKEAIIRELHVYGQQLSLGKKLGKETSAAQHKGLGKQLMHEAESIARKNKIKNLKVISGVGVREYYENLGYNLDKKRIYMEKKL